MKLQELTNIAADMHKTGKDTEALKFYNKAFELLANKASVYAHEQPETFRDDKTTTKGEKVRVVLPKLFDETKKYLKRDEVAYLINKNMVVIYHELGDNKSAVNALEQAVELAPDGHDCSDAINGLEKLKK